MLDDILPNLFLLMVLLESYFLFLKESRYIMYIKSLLKILTVVEFEEFSIMLSTFSNGLKQTEYIFNFLCLRMNLYILLLNHCQEMHLYGEEGLGNPTISDSIVQLSSMTHSLIFTNTLIGILCSVDHVIFFLEKESTSMQVSKLKYVTIILEECFFYKVTRMNMLLMRLKVSNVNLSSCN